MYKRYCTIRDYKKMKDSDVARLSGVTKSTFSDWKAGRYEPKDEKLEKIAQVLGTTVRYLRTGKLDEIASEDTIKDENERRLLMLYRNITDKEPEKKETLIELFEATIELYKKITGINAKIDE